MSQAIGPLLGLDAVAAILTGATLDAKLIARIDPDRKLADVADDLAEIGYQTP